MIPHIDDLDPIEFSYWIKQINEDKVIYTQKLDGSMNLSITKVDDRLQFSRYAKGQMKDYTIDNIPQTPIYNPLISAITFLTNPQVYDTILNAMDNGETLDLEVLYGSQPNTIAYYEDYNYIAILRYLSNDKSKQINDIYKKVENIKVSNNDTLYKYIYVDDIIETIHVDNTWKFMIPGIINGQIEMKGKLMEYVNDCDHILNEVNPLLNMTNRDIYLSPLNTGCAHTRNLIRMIKLLIDRRIAAIKKRAKALLVSRILNEVFFDFGVNDQEGLVLSLADDPRMVKLVDKDKFTQKNKSNWFYIELADDGIKYNGVFYKGILSSLFSDLSKILDIPSMVQYKKFVKSNVVPNSFIINNKIKQKLIKAAYNYSVQLMCLYNGAAHDSSISIPFIDRTYNSVGLINNKIKAYINYLENNSHINSCEFVKQLKQIFIDIYAYIK